MIAPISEFSEAFAKLKKIEGGYVFNWEDAGGETYAGITRVNHPKWEGWKYIDDVMFRKTAVALEKERKKNSAVWKKVSKEIAKIHEIPSLVHGLYRKKYWDPIDYKFLHKNVKQWLFITSIHSSKKEAIRELQRTIGATVDGRIGPNTKEAYNKNYLPSIIFDLIDERFKSMKRYKYKRGPLKGQKMWTKFKKGWTDRVKSQREFVLNKGMCPVDHPCEYYGTVKSLEIQPGKLTVVKKSSWVDVIVDWLGRFERKG